MKLGVRMSLWLLAGVCTAIGCGRSVSVESVQASLQGKWQVVDAERRGVKNPGYIGLLYEFAGDRLRVSSDTKTGAWSQYALDVATSPRRIEWQNGASKQTATAKTHGCINQLEGEELRICWPMNGSDYPASFSSKPDNVLLILKRLPAS